MAITELINGIETVTTTEWSMATDTSYDTGDAQTTDGVFQVFLEVAALASTDEYRVRIYEKVRSAGTQRVVYDATLVGTQPGPFVSPSLILMHGWDMTIIKVAGTDRSIEWSIRQLT
jgi:hypothetical protein